MVIFFTFPTKSEISTQYIIIHYSLLKYRRVANVYIKVILDNSPSMLIIFIFLSIAFIQIIIFGIFKHKYLVKNIF